MEMQIVKTQAVSQLIIVPPVYNGTVYAWHFKSSAGKFSAAGTRALMRRSAALTTSSAAARLENVLCIWLESTWTSFDELIHLLLHFKNFMLREKSSLHLHLAGLSLSKVNINSNYNWEDIQTCSFTWRFRVFVVRVSISKSNIKKQPRLNHVCIIAVLNLSKTLLHAFQFKYCISSWFQQKYIAFFYCHAAF